MSILQVIDYSGNTLYKTDHVSYKSSVTPAITEITPSDAGTGGGKEVICSILYCKSSSFSRVTLTMHT